MRAQKKRRAATRTKRRVPVDNAGFLRRMLTMALFAVCITLIVEGFNQASVGRTVDYLRGRHLFFALDCLVVLRTLSLTELFKRRKAATWTIAAIWVILGFSNYMVVRNRTLPLIGGDLILTYEVVSLITVYFNWLQIGLMFVAAVVVIAGIAWMFSATARRRRVNYAFGAGVVAIMCLLTFGAHMALIKADLMPDSFPDRVNAYREYGFTACFSFTFGQRGIEKPQEYSSETVEEIVEESAQLATAEDAAEAVSAAQRFDAEAIRRPNILFVQLESFFDVDTIADARFSRDPIPNFHRLMQEWPNACLYVPTVGGGTANVEFEVMSGLNMDFFGSGETPYSTIIQETSCETIAHILRGYGYTSTAMHNNTGTFFSRNTVYANLGYDCFDSLEYMRDPTYNAVGWAHDAVLTDEILRAMRKSEGRDMIFAITVESHGKYDDTYVPKEGDVEVLAMPEDMYQEAFRNYVNIIETVDGFIDDLLHALRRYDEPIVVVLYGDHLPGLGLRPEMLSTGDYYASRYIIWNNYGAEFEAPDLQAYRLSAELLRQIGISDGVMMQFHQAYPVDEEGEAYIDKLRILEYDLLYGEKEAYGESGAPAPTALQMGIEPIEIDGAVIEYGRMLVSGSGFTEFSRVLVGDEAMPTVYIDGEHIAVAAQEIDAEAFGGAICVAQLSPDGKELSRTEEHAVETRMGHQ